MRAAVLATVLAAGGFLGWMVTSERDGEHINGDEPPRVYAAQPASQAPGPIKGASGSPRLEATYARALLGIASVKTAGFGPIAGVGFDQGQAGPVVAAAGGGSPSATTG